jgi:hypothetical protein
MQLSLPRSLVRNVTSIDGYPSRFNVGMPTSMLEWGCGNAADLGCAGCFAEVCDDLLVQRQHFEQRVPVVLAVGEFEFRIAVGETQNPRD